MKKKLFVLLTICLFAVMAFCGCGQKDDIATADDSAGTMENAEVVTTESALEKVAAYYRDHASDLSVVEAGGEWVVIGFARSDVAAPDGFFNQYYDLLEQKVVDCGGVLDEMKYTEYSRPVLALTAIGEDPQNIGGYDLLLPLADFEKTCAQGLNGPIWALIALNSGNYELPQNTEAVTQATADMYLQHILSVQNEDGSFALSGTEGDVDLTAMALQALSFYRDQEAVAPVIDKAVQYLSSVQDEDGGFSSYGEGNLESCAQVLTAISSLNISVDDERFVKNGNNVFDALMTYALEDGSFTHSKSVMSTDQMATEQAFCALTALDRMEKGMSPLFDMSK